MFIVRSVHYLVFTQLRVYGGSQRMSNLTLVLEIDLGVIVLPSPNLETLYVLFLQRVEASFYSTTIIMDIIWYLISTS